MLFLHFLLFSGSKTQCCLNPVNLSQKNAFFFSEDSSSNGKCHCMLALSFVVSVCEAKHNYKFVIRITVLMILLFLMSLAVQCKSLFYNETYNKIGYDLMI